jgi:hypothetical protein
MLFPLPTNIKKKSDCHTHDLFRSRNRVTFSLVQSHQERTGGLVRVHHQFNWLTFFEPTTSAFSHIPYLVMTSLMAVPDDDRFNAFRVGLDTDDLAFHSATVGKYSAEHPCPSCGNPSQDNGRETCHQTENQTEISLGIVAWIGWPALDKDPDKPQTGYEDQAKER